MTRIQFACCLLIASAMVLAGLLVARLPDNVVGADMVNSRADYQLMTVLTANGEEAVFLLDNRAEKIVVYTVDVRGNRGKINPVGFVNLAKEFPRVLPPPPPR